MLAGILGSLVTYGYGPEGKHGANYMQTMAASVASMCGDGRADPGDGVARHAAAAGVAADRSTSCCIGMFGVGVGMLYTPMLVDRMQLTYPSGLAVANILRALTDPKILRALGRRSSAAASSAAASLSWLAERRSPVDRDRAASTARRSAPA